ncbi:hypothetical protein HHK36_018149 [Tetracentron sinense]|uniref:ACT domain-containing protein ACR n=1 Tax=Tetracentron sinense TaxID=13715 RepID=A0A834YZF8_TETSI|nr:hypothetical protein HHK36_018149 [Tetracentron sinense]
MEFSTLMLEIPDMPEKDLFCNFMDGLQNWAEQDLQRCGVQDLATAMAVAEQLVEFKNGDSKGKPRTFPKVNQGKDGGEKASSHKEDPPRHVDNKEGKEKRGDYIKGKAKSKDFNFHGSFKKNSVRTAEQEEKKARKLDSFLEEEDMGIPYDDVVIIRQSEKPGEPSEITVNCPDKRGLGCDLCRIILFFGLSIVRGDVSTDGKWCYIVFWVLGKSTTRWSLLKKRLSGACPSCSSASVIYYYRSELQHPKPPDVFLLKFCSSDRRGLLHDVTEALCELELTIKKVKVSTTPEGRVMDFFYIKDTRELLHTKKRQEDAFNHLKTVLGDGMISCEIELAGPEIAACSQGSSFLPSAITEEIFSLELPDKHPSGSLSSSSVSVTVDNSLSPAHTLVQILCQDHKGLLYDIMRTLKDYNIQISYGRFSANRSGNCEVDLFIVQADGKKIVDATKLNALCSRLRMELLRPLRIVVLSRGPDTELLVANPVELSGKGRPLVFYDITLALKMLNTCIFTAEIGRHVIGDREWEVYRVLLDEGEGFSVPKNKIEEEVRKMLMGWN